MSRPASSESASGGQAAGQSVLDAAGLRSLVARIAARFARHETELNQLNVFPVADGDTGVNVRATADAVVEATEGEEHAALPKMVARAALLGARGNSGVILSQVLRALAEAVGERGALDGAGLAAALTRARALGYQAVADPVEGTILTAVRAAEEAAAAVGEPALAAVTAAVREAVHAAVLATPAQLEVLRRHGVVDAGARSFELVCEELDALARGEDASGAQDPREVAAARRAQSHTAGAHRSEVQYLLDCPEQEAPRLRERLEALGDSVVVGGAGGLLRVHLHTGEIGAAIEAGLAFGRPSQIQVTCDIDTPPGALGAPAAGAHPGPVHEAGEASAPATPGDAPGALALLAVLPGPGLRALAAELGAESVAGGAGALPSVRELVDAASATGARSVALLPGDRDVVAGARQARALLTEQGVDLLVVEAASSPAAVLAALGALAFGVVPEDPQAAVDALEQAAATCRSGEVVLALHAAETPLGPVHPGQPMARVAGEVVALAEDAPGALRAVLEGLAPGGAELVTVAVGAEVGADERRAAEAAVDGFAAAGQVEWVEGGQQHPRYLVGVSPDPFEAGEDG